MKNINKKIGILFSLLGYAEAGMCECPSLTLTYQKKIDPHGHKKEAQFTNKEGFSSFYQESSSSSSSMQQVTLSGEDAEGKCLYSGEEGLGIQINRPTLPLAEKDCSPLVLHIDGKNFSLTGKSSGFGCTYANESFKIETE